MADDVILVTESGQTKLQAYTNTIAGNSVKAEAIVQVDPLGVPVPRGTVGDPQFAKLTDGANSPVITNTAPGVSNYGLVTRPILYAVNEGTGVPTVLKSRSVGGVESLDVYIQSQASTPVIVNYTTTSPNKVPSQIYDGAGVANVASVLNTTGAGQYGMLVHPDFLDTYNADVTDRSARLLGRLNGSLSTGNSSTALLGISGVFTGAFEDVTDYAAITISVFSDQASAAGGFEFDWSHDGTNLDASSTTSVMASVGRAFSISPRARFFRVKYTNGAVAQGVFRLGTVYHPSGSGLISRPFNQSMDQDNYAQQVRSVTDGYDGSVFQHVGARTAAPQATDYGLITRGLVYRNALLGLYYGESGNQTVLASAHAATAGFFWLVNTSSTVKAYIRSIGFVWSGTAATAFPTSPRVTVERITFTGTPSGATLTPAKRASADAANVATLRTASTGMTITAGAVIESFVVGSILTAVGAVSVPEETWQSPDDDGLIVLGQNEGVVVRQADAGTTADSRKIVMTLAWEER